MVCPYDEDLEMVEDYDMYRRAADKGFRFVRVEEALVMHRLHEGQISAERAGEMEDIHRKLALPSAEAARTVLVSVVVPTYNRPHLLREALESILTQTYRHFEIIVVNDGGEDVQAIIDDCKGEERITYLRHTENRGLPTARNTALKAARGKYIAYLDDDDVYYPRHLEILVHALETGPYRLAYTDSCHVFQEWITDRYVPIERKTLYQQDFDPDLLLIGNYIPVDNVMHAKELLSETGIFDEALDAHEDWDLWIRCAQHTPFQHIAEITVEVRFRSDGTTMTSADRAPFLRTMKIIHRRYGSLVSNPQVAEQQKAAERAIAEEIEAAHHKDVEVQPSRMSSPSDEQRRINRLQVLEAELRQEQQRVQELNSLLLQVQAAYKAAAASLDEVCRSTAWRITYPLRRTGTVMKSALRWVRVFGSRF
jgi:hypothetical protein